MTRLTVLLSAFLALTLLAVAPSAFATLEQGDLYGAATYTPGTQHGGIYDCPINGDRAWAENRFYKSGAITGKAIFINPSGGWIATNESANTITVVSGAGSGTKKGSVRNTSTSTYNGYGAVFYNDQVWCV